MYECNYTKNYINNHVCLNIRGETNIKFQVRMNSCPNQRTRTSVPSRFPNLRNVVKDGRCVACKLRLHSSIDIHFKQSKKQILLWRTWSIPSSGFLLQLLIFRSIRWSGCIMLVCSMLRVDLWYCAHVHALSVHCTIM